MILTVTLEWRDPLDGAYYDRRVLVDTEGIIPDIGYEITFDGPSAGSEHCVRIERMKHGTHTEGAPGLHHRLYITPNALVSPVTESDAEAMRACWRSVIPKAFHFHEKK